MDINQIGLESILHKDSNLEGKAQGLTKTGNLTNPENKRKKLEKKKASLPQTFSLVSQFLRKL